MLRRWSSHASTLICPYLPSSCLHDNKDNVEGLPPNCLLSCLCLCGGSGGNSSGGRWDHQQGPSWWPLSRRVQSQASSSWMMQQRCTNRWTASYVSWLVWGREWGRFSCLCLSLKICQNNKSRWGATLIFQIQGHFTMWVKMGAELSTDH